MGVVTATNIKHSVFGDRRYVTADVTFSTSYAAGGDTGLLALLGLKTTDWLKAENKSGLQFEWDEANGLLLAIFPSGGDTTSPTALDDPIVTAGSDTASAVEGTTPLITPGVGKEVAATADLSALVGAVRVAAVGL